MARWGSDIPQKIALTDIKRRMAIRTTNGRGWMRVLDIAPPVDIDGRLHRIARVEYLTGSRKGQRESFTFYADAVTHYRMPPQNCYRRRPEGGWYVIRFDREVGYVIHSATAREWHGFAYWGPRRDRRHVGSHPTRDGARDLLCAALAR